EVRSDLHTLLRGGLDQLRTEAVRLLTRQKKQRAREEQTRIEYESIPRSDTIELIAKDREEHRSEIAELEAMHAALGQDIERQQRELERREQALARLLESDAKDQGRRDDRSRIL